MADAWTIPGGVPTLTLDGTGTGVVAKERVFNFPTWLNKQVTFYIDITADNFAVEPFLWVLGGDQTIATENGEIRARGDTDGSGNITVRIGVRKAEAAPGAIFFSDDLNYTTIADAVSAGWTAVTDGAGSLSIATDEPAEQAHVLKATVGTSGNAYLRREFACTPGTHFTLRGRGRQDASRGFDTGTRIEFDPGADAHCQSASWTDESVSRTESGSVVGIIVGRRGGYFGIPGTYWGKFRGITLESDTVSAGATIEFDDLTYCLGSGKGDGGTGIGDGDGDGGPGTDPPPEPPPGGWKPPPVGGTRPFGIYEISAGGNVGYWNSTVKQVTEDNIEDILNDAFNGDMKVMLVFAITRLTLTNGVFDYNKWNAIFTACYTNTRIRNRILAAQNEEGWCHNIMDEPNRADRWGGEVPFVTVEKMSVRSKELFPDWRTMLRLSPTIPWWTRANRHMNGLDTLWAEYLEARGEIHDYFDQNLEACDRYNHTLISGLHYGAIDRAETGHYISTAKYDYYGHIIADLTSPLIVGMSGWKYSTAMWNQAGFPEMNRSVRDTFASHDPP